VPALQLWLIHCCTWSSVEICR